MKKADMIIDLQFGSTGKGLVAGYLAEKNGYDTVINANMPNAGHTYINDEGRKWIHKVIPNGIVSPNLKRIMIGPGSVFDLDRLRLELNESEDLTDKVQLIIHPAAVVLQRKHRLAESAALSGISSTMQGSAAAMIEKIWRQKDKNPTALEALKDTEFRESVCSTGGWQKHLAESENILIEGAQGYSLGINAGFYPYCTSRECTPARFLSDCAIPITMLRKVIGTARVHPIRVGNTPNGFSGDCYPDQDELTWDELRVDPETTTVTGRERRVFTFSRTQIEHAIGECQPDEVFLNFCNYDNDEADYVADAINGAAGFEVVRYLGFGATRGDVVDLVDVQDEI
ncbi:MAG: adenylosuccinate synthetase [Deltaproteobacteria bacterium]|nr:adenylosuccinate synthetase [Deltaproteobacteria bacterium]